MSNKYPRKPRFNKLQRGRPSPNNRSLRARDLYVSRSALVAGLTAIWLYLLPGVACPGHSHFVNWLNTFQPDHVSYGIHRAAKKARKLWLEKGGVLTGVGAQKIVLDEMSRVMGNEYLKVKTRGQGILPGQRFRASLAEIRRASRSGPLESGPLGLEGVVTGPACG